MANIKLKLLDGSYAVSQLPAADRIPAWADGPGFMTVSRTEDELSVVCLEDRVPADVRSEHGWACFKFAGPFAFDQTGILLSVVSPLSNGGIGIFAVSTFDTDYLLVKRQHLAQATALLHDAGHILA